MDNSEIKTDIQLFTFTEGDTILKGLLVITLLLLLFVGIMVLYNKKFINYFYVIFVIAFIIYTFLFDTYHVERYGFYSISILVGFVYCIYLNYNLSKKNY